MKRKVHVISVQNEFLHTVSKQLKEVLGDRIEISSMTIKNLEMDSVSDRDIVILSKEILKGITRPFIPETCSIIIAKRDINIVSTKELINLPAGQKIVVVNDTVERAKETAISLKNIYFEHDYFVDDGVESMPLSVDFIVTPGEMQLVPSHFKNAIDIGPRVLDFNTFLELSNLIEEDYDQQLLMNRFMKSQVSLAIGTENKSEFQKASLILNGEDQKTIEINSYALTEEKMDLITDKIEEHGFLEESLKILELYEAGKKQFQTFGRLRLKEMLESNGFFLSEQQVRIRLEVLQELGLLHARQGRGGTTITAVGERFLKNNEVAKAE